MTNVRNELLGHSTASGGGATLLDKPSDRPIPQPRRPVSRKVGIFGEISTFRDNGGVR